MAEESRSRRYYQPERKRIRSNSTGVEVERRDLMRGMGDKEDRGASVADLRARAAGTNATPESPAMAALKARNPGATPWQPGGAGGAAPFRGSTGAEVADFQAGANPGAVAAKTGQPVATPQGTVGVRFAQKGETMQPAQVTATGVVRGDPLNWQQNLVRQFPALGVEGSQANAEFVKSYKAAQAAGGQVDPNLIAQSVMQNITQPTPVAQMPEGIAQADIAAPAAMTAPQTPSAGVQAPTFAGAPVTATPWNPIQPTTPAQDAGSKVRGAVVGALTGPSSPVGLASTAGTAAKSVGGAIKKAAGSVMDFSKGLLGTGAKPTPPAPGAITPTPSVPATDFPLTDPARRKKPGAFDSAATAFSFQ